MECFTHFFLYNSVSNVLSRKIAYMISSKAWLFAQVTIQLLEQTNLLEENVHLFIASCIPFFYYDTVINCWVSTSVLSVVEENQLSSNSVQTEKFTSNKLF